MHPLPQYRQATTLRKLRSRASFAGLSPLAMRLKLHHPRVSDCSRLLSSAPAPRLDSCRFRLELLGTPTAPTTPTTPTTSTYAPRLSSSTEPVYPTHLRLSCSSPASRGRSPIP